MPIGLSYTTPLVDGDWGVVFVEERGPQRSRNSFAIPTDIRGAELLVAIADGFQEQVFSEQYATWGEARPACPGTMAAEPERKAQHAVLIVFSWASSSSQGLRFKLGPMSQIGGGAMKKRSVAAATAALAVLSLSGSTAAASTPSCPLPQFGPGRAYHPQINPADFGPSVTNPLFPLKPGRTLVYRGTKDQKKALNIFQATSRTKVIDGVTTRVVEDRLYLDNVLEERTSDYYAQDRCGNVWYFGEDTATLDRQGHVVSTDGSFHAGVDGAQPGVFMQAHPEVGRRFRQEWYQGHAEDTFKVLKLSASVTVPYRTFSNALKTQETTALEPTVVDNKYFVPGIGEVEELAVKGPLEKLQLVEIIE